MKIADANIYLRYLLNENEESYLKSKNIIENNELYLPTEVLCEVVFVLDKVYHAIRKDICETLVDLVQQPNIHMTEQEVIIFALRQYSQSKLDFVDCILLGYACVQQIEVFTFDEKLVKRISQIGLHD